METGLPQKSKLLRRKRKRFRHGTVGGLAKQYMKYSPGEYMRTILVALCLGIAAPIFLGGCLGSFASNQARRQAARSADHYVKEYVEPELDAAYGNDPQYREEFRQGRNDLADTIVRSGNPRQQGRVGVDDRGWLTKEDR